MLSLLALVAACAPALVLAQDQEIYRCDTTIQPDFTNCDAVESSIQWKAGDDGTGDAAPITDGHCGTWLISGNTGNCVVQACNNRGDGHAEALNVFNGHTYYGIVKQWCGPDDAGGQAPWPGKPTYIGVYNNPDYKPASRVKRATLGEVVYQMMTIAEADALVEKAKQAVPTPSKLRQRDDVKWTNIATSLKVKSDKRDQLSAASSSGSTQQWSTTEGFSSSVTSTVEVGASFFDIFSASVSISVSFEYSESYTETLTFDPSGRCDKNQRAILYMYPLFDRYTGWYSDNPGKEIDWFIPVPGPNNYEIAVECLG